MSKKVPTSKAPAPIQTEREGKNIQSVITLPTRLELTQFTEDSLPAGVRFQRGWVKDYNGEEHECLFSSQHPPLVKLGSNVRFFYALVVDPTTHLEARRKREEEKAKAEEDKPPKPRGAF